MKKNFLTKALSMLLCLVMLLSAVPAVALPQAQAEEAAPTSSDAPRDVIMDFRADLRQAMQFDWWNDLRNTTGMGFEQIGDVKVIGIHSYANASAASGGNTPHTATELAAIEKFFDYIKTEHGWWLDGGSHDILATDSARQYYFNISDHDYGIRFYPDTPGIDYDDTSTFILKFNVEAEGLYHFDMSFLSEYREQTNVHQPNVTRGGAIGDVFLNGEQILVDHVFESTSKQDQLDVMDMGNVWLTEGENEFRIYVQSDVFGNQGNARRVFNLRSLEFTNLADRDEAVHELDYKIDGEKEAEILTGDVLEGEVAVNSTWLRPQPESWLFAREGTVVFENSNPDAASVDSETGDITGIGEGDAIITAYWTEGDKTWADSVEVHVRDNSDMASVEIYSAVDFLGEGGYLKLFATGSKVSGCVADLKLHEVVWSVDDEDIAYTDDRGYLYGVSAGTVTVTCTVDGIVSDSAEYTIIPAEELPGRDLLFDFVDGRADPLRNKELTLEDSNVIINYDETSASDDLIFSLQGICTGGKDLVLEIMVDRAGWYWLQVRGGLFVANGAEADVFVDDQYMGNISFCDGAGGHYNAKSNMNTLYLTPGQHKVKLTATQAGTMYLGKLYFFASEDPNEMDIDIGLEKTELLERETADVLVSFDGANGRAQYLKLVTKKPEYTNWYMLEVDNRRVLRVNNGRIIAAGAGTCNLIVSGQWQGEDFSETIEVTVSAGTVATVALTAEDTTVRPDHAPIQLQLIGYGPTGDVVELPAGVTVAYESEDETIATVDENGLVTLTGELGDTEIKATVTEGSRTMEATCWIVTTLGKTEPKIYTNEERAIAQENAKKYSWAWDEKEEAVNMADYYIENLETILDNWIREGTVPRACRVGYYYNSGNALNFCRYCGCDVVSTYGAYPWQVDPIEHPWKIQCINCERWFPSNDFESYYKSGLDEAGYFHKELADPQYLKNELYPEMGEGWGVDAGPGYDSGVIWEGGTINDVHTYLAYYMHTVFCVLGASKHSMAVILETMTEAYVYTGDEKYGNAGAIMIDRLADIYPEYKRAKWSTMYSNADGNGLAGRMVGCIWEANVIGPALAKAADAFWPCFDNAEVVEYIRQYPEWKGVTAEEITPELLRENLDDGICRTIRKGFEEGDLSGNFGMSQASLCYAARALDQQPESQEMIELAFRYGTRTGTAGNYVQDGGAIFQQIIDSVDRDGFGNEVSWSYNNLWLDRLLAIADAMDGYEIEGYDLWQNARFVNMFTSMSRLLTCGSTMPDIGETGRVQMTGNALDVAQLTTGFINTGNRDIARALYAANGNTVDGIHGDIFTKNPEAGMRNEIQTIINEDGVWSRSESDLMAGYGLAILRDGPELYLGASNRHEFSDYWMYFGKTVGGHGSRNALHIDMDAFGLNISSHMGYPIMVDSNPERMQWVLNTTSHNTVVVNDRGQSELEYGGFPLHFDDAGKVKVMDADAANAYPETDIYRRTMVVVDNGDGTDLNYAVDFFRILGGEEHVYSFHAAGDKAPTTEGLDMVKQISGTYAGRDVPFGDWDFTGMNNATYNTGAGYSWLFNVSRDSDPDTVFAIDFPVEDFHHQMNTSAGIHLKLHMVSEEPLTEVAIADARPPQNGINPDIMKYALIRKSGEPGMDTLFTSVIEPYQIDNYIAGTELVDAVLVDGKEGVSDRVAAIKVTLENGREDYVVYATNPDCTYEIGGKFQFRGFTGVVSYMEDSVVYAYGNEATKVADVIEDELPAVTGEVVSFTHGITLDHEMVVTANEAIDVAELADRYIYVNNDGFRNAAYRIYGAEDNGDTITLKLKAQSLVRELVDIYDTSKGYVYNISEGDTYSIPLSVTFDKDSVLTYTSDQVVKAGNKLSLTTGVAGCGASYEAEGLATSMKFDSKTGLLTWSTSRTQTGRYPITVKAVKDGATVGEMSFVIYVVNYSGTAYDPSVCTHAKAVTFEADGMIETVCPACGTISKTEIAQQKFSFVGSNMTLGNELKQNFLVKTTDLKDGYKAAISHNGETVEAAFQKFDGNYSFVSYSVAAKQMADAIEVVVVDADGKEVSEPYTSSVRDYAMKALIASTSTAKVKTMVVDMLNYGAAAQTYFQYNEKDLANSKLTDAQKGLATGTVSCTDKRVQGENYYGSNLSLEDRIILNLFFKNCEAGMTAKVTYKDYKGRSVIVDAELVKYSDSIYMVAVDEIVLADAFSPVTVTVYDGKTVHGTATDSVESYVARAEGSDLYETIIKFATSAKNYFA